MNCDTCGKPRRKVVDKYSENYQLCCTNKDKKQLSTKKKQHPTAMHERAEEIHSRLILTRQFFSTSPGMSITFDHTLANKIWEELTELMNEAGKLSSELEDYKQ